MPTDFTTPKLRICTIASTVLKGSGGSLRIIKRCRRSRNLFSFICTTGFCKVAFLATFREENLGGGGKPMIRLFVSILIFGSLTGFAKAQHIDLGIQNIQQQGQAWCWVAVAQQIAAWKTGQAPQQCAMVAVANGTSPSMCCPYNPACDVPGSMQQIQLLLAQYGGVYSGISPPAHPAALFQTLSQGRAVIMLVRNSPVTAVGHFVVVRGMDFTPQGPVVFLNDPMAWSGFSQPIPFVNLMHYWQAAIVVM